MALFTTRAFVVVRCSRRKRSIRGRRRRRIRRSRGIRLAVKQQMGKCCTKILHEIRFEKLPGTQVLVKGQKRLLSTTSVKRKLQLKWSLPLGQVGFRFPFPSFLLVLLFHFLVFRYHSSFSTGGGHTFLYIQLPYSSS